MEIGYDGCILRLEGCPKDDVIGDRRMGRVLVVYKKKNNKSGDDDGIRRRSKQLWELLGWLWKGNEMPRTLLCYQVLEPRNRLSRSIEGEKGKKKKKRKKRKKKNMIRRIPRVVLVLTLSSPAHRRQPVGDFSPTRGERSR
ncbi:hypothetical protein GW17_00023342 [Ensete ventricosum]|nr:hypothetical protein GW17_00023342 [Ensete ventricosum]RZR86556.1 hypothetical protein BHM03_00013779 [Ensete ventricosum]